MFFLNSGSNYLLSFKVNCISMAFVSLNNFFYLKFNFQYTKYTAFTKNYSIIFFSQISLKQLLK